MTGNITIDSEAIRLVVAKGIMESLGEDQRQLIIQQAVDGLLLEPKDPYGRGSTPSPLALAFQQGVNKIAVEVVKDYLDEEKTKAAVVAAIKDQLRLIAERSGDWIYSSIGYAVGEQLAAKLRDEV